MLSGDESLKGRSCSTIVLQVSNCLAHVHHAKALRARIQGLLRIVDPSPGVCPPLSSAMPSACVPEVLWSACAAAGT